MFLRISHVFSFLPLTFSPFLSLQFLWTLFVFLAQLMIPFTFSAVLLFVPAVHDEVYICILQHYLLTTSYSSPITSLGVYYPVVILSPTICCNFWLEREETKLAAWLCPGTLNTETQSYSQPTRCLLFPQHTTSSHHYIWKRLEEINGKALTAEFSASEIKICHFSLRYFE